MWHSFSPCPAAGMSRPPRDPLGGARPVKTLRLHAPAHLRLRPPQVPRQVHPGGQIRLHPLPRPGYYLEAAILDVCSRCLGRYSPLMGKPSWPTPTRPLRAENRARPSRGSPKMIIYLPRGV